MTARPALLLGAGSLLSQAVALLFWLVAVRVLTPLQLGQLSAVMSAAGLATLLLAAGLPSYAASRHVGGHAFSRVALFATASASLSALLAVVLLSRSQLPMPLFFTAALGAAAAAWGLAFDGWFIGRGQPMWVALRNSLAPLLRTAALGVLSLAAVASAVSASWAYALSMLLALVGAALVARFSAACAGSSPSPAPAGNMLAHQAVAVGLTAPSFALPLLVTTLLGATAAGEFYIPWMIPSALATATVGALVAAAAQGQRTASASTAVRAGLPVAVAASFFALALVFLAPALLAFVAPASSHMSAVMSWSAAAVPAVATVALVCASWRAQGQYRRAAAWAIATGGAGVLAAAVLAESDPASAVRAYALACYALAALCLLFAWVFRSPRSAAG